MKIIGLSLGPKSSAIIYMKDDEVVSFKCLKMPNSVEHGTNSLGQLSIHGMAKVMKEVASFIAGITKKNRSTRVLIYFPRVSKHMIDKLNIGEMIGIGGMVSLAFGTSFVVDHLMVRRWCGSPSRRGLGTASIKAKKILGTGLVSDKNEVYEAAAICMAQVDDMNNSKIKIN